MAMRLYSYAELVEALNAEFGLKPTEIVTRAGRQRLFENRAKKGIILPNLAHYPDYLWDDIFTYVRQRTVDNQVVHEQDFSVHHPAETIPFKKKD